MIRQKSNRIKFLCAISLFLMCIYFIILGFTTISVDAATGTPDETVYVNNTPWPTDWKHEIYYTNNRKTLMKENVSEWVKKDPDGDIIIQYSQSVSGTISYTISGSSTVGVSVLDGAISESRSLKQSLSYSYTETALKAYTWTVSPDDVGEFFCIGVNYQSRESEIKHYKQEFKLFGQGPYKYYSTTKVWTPTEKYLAKNYRYEIDGEIYEK